MPLSTRVETGPLPTPLRAFLDALSPEHKLLLVLRDQLYDGRWQPMVEDLNHRLAGKPYVFRLAERIEDDLQRIEQMTQIESHYSVDLAQLVASPAPAAFSSPSSSTDQSEARA